jgi:hypothetical protein
MLVRQKKKKKNRIALRVELESNKVCGENTSNRV